MNEEPESVEEERQRSRRSVGFIVSVVVASVLVLIGLTIWVTAMPYDDRAPLGGAIAECDAIVESDSDAESVREWRRACETVEDEARSTRRTQAIVIGATVVVIAMAVSTWPSRRLTGERLGPLR